MGIGRTPLLFVLFVNDVERLQLLLSNCKIDLNLKDGHGWTPLMLAVRKNGLECMYFLLADPRVDPNTKINNGDSALMDVAKQNKVLGDPVGRLSCWSQHEGQLQEK